MTVFAVLAGSQEMGLTWDEALAHFGGSEILREWLVVVKEGFQAGEWGVLTDPAVLQKYWPVAAPEEQGTFIINYHPPLTRILPTLTWYLFHGWTGETVAYRLAPALLFGFSILVVFRFMAREFDYATGLFSAFSLLLMPRVFGHAHIAATDMAMMCFWLFCVIAFHKGLSDRRWSYIFAVLLGLAWSVKFTGFMIPLALILYMVLARETRAWRNIAVSFFISPVILFLLNPTWWADPVTAFFDNYLVMMLSRGQFTPIDNFYLGQTYLLNTPWHHAFVLTAVTVPLGILLFALAGGILNFKRLHNKVILLFLSQPIFYYLILLLPMSPHFDGVRLFLPVFPFVACFAGLGFERVRGWIFNNFTRLPGWLSRLGKERITVGIFVVVFFWPGVKLAAMHPFYLEYYNSLVGGVAGAHRLGFETTYWFDTVTASVRERINQLPPDSKVGVHPPRYPYFQFLQAKGLVNEDLEFNPENMDYFILLPRKGKFKPWHWQLYLNNEPYYKVNLEGVPMILIYRIGK